MSAIGQRPNETTPSWPSLYNPSIDYLHIEHREPVQPGGAYLYHARDIFRFTLYWTLIIYTPVFLICGIFAFLNLTFPPSHNSHSLSNSASSPSYPLSPLPLSETEHTFPANVPLLRPRSKPQRRSRLTFALLVLLTFLALSVAGAVIGSVVLGFVLAGLFKAAKYNMSTWVPFLWAVIQILVGLLSIWPSIIDII